ncbi:hypothetical protein PG984_015166 [Apiospora sp. TS-2023a]
MAVRDRLIEQAGIGEQSGHLGPVRPSQLADDNRSADPEDPHDDQKATENSGLDEVDDQHDYKGVRGHDDDGYKEGQSGSSIHLSEAGDVDMSDSAGPSTLSSTNHFIKHDRGLTPVTREPHDGIAHIERTSLGIFSKADINQTAVGYANDVDMHRFEELSKAGEVPKVEGSVDMEDKLVGAILPPEFPEQEYDEVKDTPEPKTVGDDPHRLPAVSSIAEELSAGIAAWQDEQGTVGDEEPATATDEGSIHEELPQATVMADQREVEQDDVDDQSDLKHETVSKSWASTIHRLWQRSRVMGVTGLRRTYRITKKVRRPSLRTLLLKPRDLMSRSALPRRLSPLPIRLPRSLTWYQQPLHQQGLSSNTLEPTNRGASGTKQDQTTDQSPDEHSEQMKENDGEEDSG